MMRKSLLAMALALPLLAGGCASAPERDAQVYDRQLPKVLAALEARGDADSLAAAAVLSLGDDGGTSLARIQRATLAAPDRPDLAWLALAMCGETELCDSEPLEARLGILDPRNGAAALETVYRASRAKQADLILRGLRGMADSEAVKTYWLPLQRNLIPAVASTGKLSQAESINAIIGGLASWSFPNYSPISKSCVEDSLGTVGMLEACRGAALALSRGDTYLTQSMGLALQARLWPTGSMEASAAREALRVARYRMSVVQALDVPTIQSGNYQRYLHDVSSYPTEQAYFEARIVRAGKSANPPADWVEPAAVSSPQ